MGVQQQHAYKLCNGPFELTCLHTVQVTSLEVFQPAVLGHMPQLRGLHLKEVYSLSPLGVDGVRSLLAVLPKPQHLNDLEFCCCHTLNPTVTVATLQGQALNVI